MKEILLTSSVLIAALLVLRRLFRKTISRRVQYALWGLVLVRLLVPVQLPAVEHNVLTAAEPVRQSVAAQLETRQLYILPQEPVELPELYIPVEHAPLEEHPDAADDFPFVLGPSFSGGWVRETETTATKYRQLTATDYLLAAWGVGMIVMAAWFLLSNLRFYRKLRKARTPYAVEGCKYRVYLVDCLPSPCLFGLFRPAVYLTPAAVSSEDTLRHVLAHEMTHARHLDPLWSLLRCVCLVVYWFDPLVWAAAIVSRQDCELACDEGALKKLGEAERIPYGQTLLRLIPVAKHPGSPLLSATTMTTGKKELKERITRIAENRRTVGVALLAVLTAAALVCAVTFTAAKPHTDPLTYQELNSYSALLNDTRNTIKGRQFLTSTYETPEDINKFQLFYYGTTPGDECTPEERRLLVDTYWGGEDPGVALIKITSERVDKILQVYTGMTLAESNTQSMDNFYYLADYDAYYHFRAYGDTSSYVRFYAGERQENGDVTLYYRAEPFKLVETMGSTEEVWAKVTLRPADDFDETGSYTFRSNQLCKRPDDLLGEVRSLTGEELTFFNEEFFNNDTSADGAVTLNYRNQFLRGYYDSPQDIDLYGLLYCGVGSNEGLSEDELQQVGLLDDEAYPICPTEKMSTAAIDAFLLENTGITLEEANKDSLRNFVYLLEYDAYYHSHGDTNYYYNVRFIGGERVGDYIHLYYQDDSHGSMCLTLLDRGEGAYWFVANQLASNVVTPTVYPEGEPWMTLPLDGLTSALPQKMSLVRHTDDCAERGGGIQEERSPSSPSYTIRCYRSTDGNLYFAVMREESVKQGEVLEWEADVFFTVPQYEDWRSVDFNDVPMSYFFDLLGYESGFTITYPDYITGGPGQGGEFGDVTDYYVIDDDGVPFLIAHAYGDCESIDLNGDGENELCAASGASGQIFYRRNNQIYEADIKAMLKEAWPELQYWDYGHWDHNYRRLAISGFVAMPEWGDGSASFTRYVYLNKDGLLVYKPTEKTVTDHVVNAAPDVPPDVLAAAKAVALEDYQARKNEDWLKDAKLDDWRVESLSYTGTYSYDGGSIAVYSMNHEFHAQEPRNVMLAGGSYITEDAWCMIGYPYCNYLFFLEQNGQRTFLEMRMINDMSPGTAIFEAEMDDWAVELGISTMENTEDETLLYQLYYSPSQFLTKLSRMEEGDQRDICRRIWEFQNRSVTYNQSLYILSIQTLHWISGHSFDEQEAAAFDILLQEGRADEAAAQAQTILNALMAQGTGTVTLYEQDGSTASYPLDPTDAVTAARAAAFADSFFWTETGPRPASSWQGAPRLTLTSAKGDITLTVFKSAEQVYCEYQGRTYAFLAAGDGSGFDGDRTYTYFRKWFDDAENRELFAAYSATLDELFVKDGDLTREQITELWLKKLGEAAVGQITRESRYACKEAVVSDVTVSDTPPSAAMNREDQLAGAEHFYFTCQWTFTPEGSRAEEFSSTYARAIGEDGYVIDGTYTTNWSGIIAKVNGRWCCLTPLMSK